jgi:hypothetical protein
MAKMLPKSNAVLNRFANWFSSAAGVWQTLLIVGAWVTAEYLHFIHDQNMFQLMAWLTIYSAITQPVLAYSNRQDTSDADIILNKIEQMEDKELILLGLLTAPCPSCGHAVQLPIIEEKTLSQE